MSPQLVHKERASQLVHEELASDLLSMFPGALNATALAVQQILEVSPGANEPKMLSGRKFNKNGELVEWELGECNIAALPESFGETFVCSGGLSLSFNQLRSLPAGFYKLRVGGDIFLTCNQLESLPPTFCQLNVGSGLNLRNNKLQSLPANFKELQIGTNLDLGVRAAAIVDA